MSDRRIERTEGIPSLTARSQWREYGKGMAAEALFVVALMTAGAILAVIAALVWL